MDISIIWWNTSLSPVKAQGRATDTDRTTALSVINLFLVDMQADIVALCELSKEDVQNIRDRCTVNGYSIVDGTNPTGKTRFDTCLLFRPDKLRLENSVDITSLKGSSTIKVGQRFDFFVVASNAVIHVFVCHWPSRLWCPQDDADRHLLGLRLRDEVESVMTAYSHPLVVVMGDFNDEPFDNSITKQLMATRDRQLVARKPHLFYNPFWRHLSMASLYAKNSSERTIGGTYYYKSDNYSRWKTFDQMLFSSSFLGVTNWHLNEKAAQVVDIPMYTEFVTDDRSRFDHLPIMAIVEEGS